MAENPSHEAQEVAELIRSGGYFKEAREWYATVYISQIADRAFFLLVSIAASITALATIIGFFLLLPISQPWPVLLRNADINQQQLSIYGLRNKGEAMDASMVRFFISAYVSSREAYEPSNFQASRAFVVAHSDPLVGQAYAAEVDPTNPKNIAALLGAGNERAVEITGLVINNESEPPVATVNFVTRDLMGGQVTTSQRRATLAFYYTPVGIKEVVDKASGETIIRTEEPQFQVVQYEHY